MTDMSTAVCTVRRTVSPSRWANGVGDALHWAPRAMPTNRLMTRPITGLLAPTAATAMVRNSPVKLPTTARSEALNSCSRMAVARHGQGVSGQFVPDGAAQHIQRLLLLRCFHSMSFLKRQILSRFLFCAGYYNAPPMPWQGAKKIPARTAGAVPGGRMI